MKMWFKWDFILKKNEIKFYENIFKRILIIIVILCFILGLKKNKLYWFGWI